jgi:ACT domain-containing protein
MRYNEITKEMFMKVRAFKREGESIVDACKKVGMARSTYYSVLKRRREERRAKLGLAS